MNGSGPPMPTKKKFISSLLQPCRKVISFVAPLAIASQGFKGSRLPSLSGAMRRGSTSVAALTSVSASSFCRSATVLQPSASIKSSVHALAASADLDRPGVPLSEMTLLKYWCEPLMSERLVTLPPPADSPIMVTLSGSPPKPAMFSCTHFSAISWSNSPRFCASG